MINNFGRMSGIILPVFCVLARFAAVGSAQNGFTFFTNFESGVSAEFSGGNSTSTQGYGRFGFGSTFLRNSTGTTVLTLTNLPPHTTLRINFDLAIIDSWDGRTVTSGGAAPEDVFTVRVDGVPIYTGVFDNFCQSDQAVSPAMLLTYGTQLGFTNTLPGTIYSCGGAPFVGNVQYVDSAYHLNLVASPHNANSVTIEFAAGGSGWQGGSDESWAIDNVIVTLEPNPCRSLDPNFFSKSFRAIPDANNFNGVIVGEFQPNPTLIAPNCTLEDVAHAYGFSHFNWINIVTQAPRDMQARCNFKTPAVDPPFNYQLPLFCQDGWNDNFVYYWNEVNQNDTLPSTDLRDATLPNNRFKFQDRPCWHTARPNHPFRFETTLVGVQAGNYHTPLHTFTWGSTFDGNGQQCGTPGMHPGSGGIIIP